MKDMVEILEKLPRVCFTVLNSDPCQVIGLKRGVPGYWPIQRMGNEQEALDTAKYFNDRARLEGEPRITKEQIAAMEAGSLFGWTVPAADPDLYTEDGMLKPREAANA